MNNVVDIQNYMPHFFFEAMCLKCLSRWIAVAPSLIILKTIECKQCGPGYVVDTGQYIEPVDHGETS